MTDLSTVDLSTHAGALAFVTELQGLLHPAPVGPHDTADEMEDSARRVARASLHLRPALLALQRHWERDGHVLADPLAWVLALQEDHLE